MLYGSTPTIRHLLQWNTIGGNFSHDAQLISDPPGSGFLLGVDNIAQIQAVRDWPVSLSDEIEYDTYRSKQQTSVKQIHGRNHRSTESNR